MVQTELPIFKASRSTDFPAFLIVWCPRDDCPGTKGNRPFMVAEKEWLRPRRSISVGGKPPVTITGRSCPYCFRASRLPRRKDIQ